MGVVEACGDDQVAAAGRDAVGLGGRHIADVDVEAVFLADADGVGQVGGGVKPHRRVLVHVVGVHPGRVLAGDAADNPLVGQVLEEVEDFAAFFRVDVAGGLILV